MQKLAIAQGKRHCGFGVDGGGVEQRHTHVHIAHQHHDFGAAQDNRFRALFDQVQHDGNVTRARLRADFAQTQLFVNDAVDIGAVGRATTLPSRALASGRGKNLAPW